MDANVVFCVMETVGDRLAPNADAVKEHRGAGALWVPPATTLSRAADAIKEHAELPASCNASFAHKGRWRRILTEEADIEIRAGVLYCFRFVAHAKKPKRRRLCPGDLPLHRMSFPVFLRQAHVTEAAFREFSSRPGTRDACKTMLSKLLELVHAGDEERVILTADFENRWGISICCGQPWWKPSSSMSAAGVVLLPDSKTFVAVMRVKPGCSAYMQSKAQLLSDEDEDCLTELGFLHWVASLVKIKPVVRAPLDITLVDDRGRTMQLRVLLQPLPETSILSNVVVRASDGIREVVVKISHSTEAEKLMEHLCVQRQRQRDHDQILNEARMLQRLHGRCSSVPPFVFSGQWEGRNVLVTELEGTSLDDRYLPLSPAMAERMIKDLASTVLELHELGVAHGDISPKNVGVYARQRDSKRMFYLYDLGFSLELPKKEGQRYVIDKMFSSADTIQKGTVNLITELVSVVYTCLYLAGVELLWQEVLDWGPALACEFREGFVGGLCEDKAFMQLAPAIRNWCEFVLQQQPSSASYGSDQARVVVRTSKQMLSL